MIENVFTITHRNEGLEKVKEYWQSADFDVRLKEINNRVLKHRGFLPIASMKTIREFSFLVKATTKIEDLRNLAVKLKEKYKIDCFQVSIDRKDSMAHMLFDFISDDGKSHVLNWLAQIRISVMILRELNLPRPQGVKKWMRYFLIDSFENDPQTFAKQLEVLERGELQKVNMPLMRDLLYYAEAMCKGQLK